MSDLSELYQEVILDHNRRPRHWGRLPGAPHHAHGANPLCGDKLDITLKIENGRIVAIAFEGSGCAISKASASLMTDAVLGLTLAEAARLFDGFHTMVTTPVGEPVDAEPLGKLAALAGVREFPIRVKCASLAWHTLNAAIAGSDSATTE